MKMLFALGGIAVLALLIGLGVRFLTTLIRIAAAGLLAAIVTGLAGPALGIDGEPLAVVSLFLLTSLVLLPLALRTERDGSPHRTWERPDAATRAMPLPPTVLAHDDAGDLARLAAAGRSSRWSVASARLRAERRRLAAAWDIVAERAAGQHSRVAMAKRACERLLAMEQGGPLSVSALDVAATIVRNVPATVEAYLRVALTGDTGATVRALDELLTSLERMAARAERETRTLGLAHATRFAFERDHLDRRSDDDRALL